MRPLDRLSLGDDVAASLGAQPRAIRLCAGISAACWRPRPPRSPACSPSSASSSPTSFGSPPGPPRAFVVPVSGICGAALLLAGDTLARTVGAPLELPVGPLMVLFGVPLFLWLLRRACELDR